MNRRHTTLELVLAMLLAAVLAHTAHAEAASGDYARVIQALEKIARATDKIAAGCR